MTLTTEARANPRNIETYRYLMEIEAYLLSDSYRDREQEHRELTALCRDFFRRRGEPSRFAFREFDA